MDVAGYGFSEAQRHLERNVAENAELLTRLLDLGNGHVAVGGADCPHVTLARALDGKLEEEVRVHIRWIAHYNGRGCCVGIKDWIRYLQSET